MALQPDEEHRVITFEVVGGKSVFLAGAPNSSRSFVARKSNQAKDGLKTV
jgi:hypothetical protein